MFGYVKVYKDELKVKEYDAFRSYYCGLCMTLKREYGFSSRLALNYDSVFLALMLSSISDTRPSLKARRCIANPLKKRPVLEENKCLSYSAAVMVILAVLKLRDDVKDEKSIKALFAYIAMLRAKRLVKKRYGELYVKSRDFIDALSSLEKENCASKDEVSHQFASLMELLFTPDFLSDEKTKRIMGHIGYMLGRFIYISDAFEDIERDKKKKCYNVFLADNIPPDKEEIKSLLTLALSSIASSYGLLNIKANKPILYNIIYLGLSKTLDDVIDGKGEKNEKSV